MLFFLRSDWWIQGEGMQWQQWARIEDEGKVGIYDTTGKVIMKTRYRNRARAAGALKRKGFRRLRQGELKELQPPEPRKRGG
ncbi:MAG: hypothetical protein R3228_19560 [Halioglobus sp.]|nr:hypothetical protein [Halioglobus sp.]